MDKKQTNPDFLETLDPAKASHNHIFIKTPTIVKDKQMDQLLENNLSSITNIVKRLVAKVEKEYGPPLKPYNWKTDWKSIIKDSLPQIRKSYIEASSVFSIAKPLPVDYRKVLYTLRKISFPLIKSPRGNFIAKTDEKWFASLLNEELKPIWRQEKTHKEWIDYFKKEYGWSKSRTSKFMSRKVSREIVPALFFELFPPNSSWGNIVKTCLKKDKLLKEVFKALPWDFLNNITYSYRNRLNTIRETINKAIAEYNFTNAKIAEIKEKYLSLEVKDSSDMDGYLECKAGHQEVKKYLKDVEDKRKDLNGDARKYTKGVNGRAKEIREELEPVRDYLGTHLKEKASKL